MLDHNTAQTIRGRVQRLHEIPPPSQSAQRLLEVLQDDGISLEALADSIENCPPVAARVIGLANSAYFGQRAVVVTVRDAIIRVLGLDMVRNIALGVALTGAFEPERCHGFSPVQYWGSALLTGQLARDLASNSKPEGDEFAPDSAYLCGMLHNLGLLALAHVAPREMEDVLGTAAHTPGRPLSTIEEEILGVHHCHVGAWLAQRWHLPDDVRAVIEHHHEPDYRGKHWPLVLLVGLCTQWARQRLADIPVAWTDSKAAQILGLSEAQVVESVDRCGRALGEIAELAKLFSRGH